MSHKFVLLIVITILLLDSCECRGGGRGKGSRGGGVSVKGGNARTGSSGVSQSGFTKGKPRINTYGTSGGLHSRRHRGYGTGEGREEKRRTSLFTRHHGKFSGGWSSSSYNGFGLGLGAGLLLGYGAGQLGRPVGYGGSGFGYSYIHQERDYIIERPTRCMGVNVSEFMRNMDQLQEINIDETIIRCNASSDVCFGSLLIRAANFTQSDGVVIEGFEVNIAKGCGVRSEINKTSLQFEGTKYDPQRKCWVSRLTEGRERFSEVAMDAGGRGVVSRDLVEALELDEDKFEMDKENVEYMYQSEVCVCEGWWCNGGGGRNKTTISFVLLILTFVTSKH